MSRPEAFSSEGSAQPAFRKAGRYEGLLRGLLLSRNGGAKLVNS
jgi:hypothetical protein